ncbi:hypothetical protein [Mongoliibacter ruber]|uniref:Uncharacterized protein n=1 Tax=Mongoliibacter ruber TaxID=1750599 RepID=A0A2T0WJ12_9BACT|nr:hypothetical protein [Mongoliibacter ruber]PRY86524.1 hypothetical protein CLW00_10811 [Mongoliibacter ruber]
MKSHLSLLIGIFLLLFNSCISDDGPFIEGNGEVVIKVATRGSYQFLIRYKDEVYYPENLPEEYKFVSQDPIPVFIKFKLTDEEADIFTPAPNDVPVFLKSIPVIRLEEINRR